MDEYLKQMGNYSPVDIDSTGQMFTETQIIESEGSPSVTDAVETKNKQIEHEIPKYMAPKTIEVRRYTLRK